MPGQRSGKDSSGQLSSGKDHWMAQRRKSSLHASSNRMTWWRRKTRNWICTPVLSFTFDPKKSQRKTIDAHSWHSLLLQSQSHCNVVKQEWDHYFSVHLLIYSQTVFVVLLTVILSFHNAECALWSLWPCHECHEHEVTSTYVIL